MREYDDYQEYEDDEQQLDLMPYVRKALKGWKKILIFAVCGGVVGVIIGISTPRSYVSKAVVAPEIATRATLGSGVSSLASLAGINMNTMALTDAMHPDMYPEIIHSTNFYLKLFDLPVTVATKDSLVHTDLYDYMVTYYKRPWWNAIMGLPFKMSAKIKSAFAKVEEYDDMEGHETVDSLRLTRQQEMVVKALAKNITAKVEKKTYVLSLKVTMQDRMIAAQVANAILDNLKDFVVAYRTEKSRENVDYYKKIYDITKSEYLAAQRAYTLYLDSHQGMTSKSSLVYQTQLQNEAQLRFQMYSQTAQNLLAAEAKVQQEAPVLVIIQPGIAPHLGKPSRIKLAMLWFILGGILGTAWVVIRSKEQS